MKINKFLLGAFALSMTFASCSNDEPAKGGDSGNVTDGEKYMSVRLRNVGDSPSRAAGEGFEDGVGKENEIDADNVRFYFFTNDGRPFLMNSTGVNGIVSNTNMVAPTEITTVVSTDGKDAEKIGTLVLGTSAEGYKGNKPYYVICVANKTAAFTYEELANITMEQFYAKKVTARDGISVNAAFPMTSSTYASDVESANVHSNACFFTKVFDNIKGSSDEAKQNPAIIYLERWVAKVRVNGLSTKPVKDTDGTTDKGYTIFDVVDNADGTSTIVKLENVKLDVELTGWRLRNLANTGYVLKNISSRWMETPPFAGWNAADLHRCYWAQPSAQAEDAIKLHGDANGDNYSIYDASQFSLKNYDENAKTANIAYCYENTFQPKSADKPVSDLSAYSTAIIVRAIVKKHGETTAYKLCEWGGDLFTEEAFKQYVIDSYNKTATTKLTRDKVGFSLYQGTDALPNKSYAYVETKEGGVTVNVHNNYRFKNISYWKDGVTSYNVNIKHLGDKFGVIRNHIYDYTLENVIGLGVPGNNPENPQPETETYLAARVYVLNWRVISNNVNLE